MKRNRKNKGRKKVAIGGRESEVTDEEVRNRKENREYNGIKGIKEVNTLRIEVERIKGERKEQ